jgi:hypothetical protein
MTEEEWLTSSDPRRLLDGVHGRGSRRRWRLFACACCRRIWPAVRDPRSRHAVELAERYADGLAGAEELAAAREGADAAAEELLAAHPSEPSAEARAAWACSYAADRSIAVMARLCASAAVEVSTRAAQSTAAAEREGLCCLIRELFGNPFRLVRADPSWLSWNRGTVAAMAAAIYRGGAFADLPVLADALEEAGCADTSILAHCRGPCDHARGCWVLDLLLGKFPAGVTSDETLEDKVAAFVWAFESVFDRDWAYTRLGLGIDAGADDETTFLNTGLTEEQESEDWGNRGALLQAYRELKRVMAALGLRCEPRPWGEEE